MEIRPIRTAEDHRSALEEVDALWGAAPGSDDGDRLDVLLALVEQYEDRNFDLPRSTPAEIVRFVMAENDRAQADLAELFGSRSRASEFLNGKRDLTIEQIRRLYRDWHIPAGALLGLFADA